MIKLLQFDIYLYKRIYINNYKIQIIMPNSNPMTVVALMNAMIGGTILILPLLYLKAGIITSLIITLLTGFINYYSCQICLDHLQDDKDLPQAIFRHSKKIFFNKLYDICIYLSVILILILYFDLIIKQWQSIVNTKSTWISILNFFAVSILVIIMKKFQLGVSLLGIGILSIFSYVVFLTWMFATSPAGDNKLRYFSFDFASLADALATAFSLQGIFIPILRQINDPKDTTKLLRYTYLFGGILYAYIGYSGAYGILNRKSNYEMPQTVQQFFPNRDWQVIALSFIYLFHLYSVFPQYLLIGKTRFYGIINTIQPEHLTYKDILFIIGNVLISYFAYITNISLETILAINGTLFGFFFIYLLPISLDLKCIYFTKNPQEIQLVNINSISKEKKESQPNKYQDFNNENEKNQQKQNSLKNQNNDNSEKQQSIQESPISSIEIKCKTAPLTKKAKYVRLTMLFLMFLFGAFIFIYSIYNLISQSIKGK